MEHGDHRDHVLALGNPLQRGGVHGDVRKARAPSGARLSHAGVDVDAVDVVEVLSQPGEERAATAPHVERLVAPRRQSRDDPGMERVVVAPRVPGVQSAHRGGGPGAHPGAQRIPHLHPPQCAMA